LQAWSEEKGVRKSECWYQLVFSFSIPFHNELH
jgi:hypothetical protein